jgi:hypothetical protein
VKRGCRNEARVPHTACSASQNGYLYILRRSFCLKAPCLRCGVLGYVNPGPRRAPVPSPSPSRRAPLSVPGEEGRYNPNAGGLRDGMRIAQVWWHAEQRLVEGYARAPAITSSTDPAYGRCNPQPLITDSVETIQKSDKPLTHRETGAES